MTTTNESTTKQNRGRQVLAAVLAVVATIAVGVYQFAPEVLVGLRTSLGLAAPTETAPEGASGTTSVGTSGAADPSEDPSRVVDEDEEDLGPAKQRPLVVEAEDTRVKPSRAARRRTVAP